VLAITKEKIVISNPDNCIKCGLCELRCPDYANWREGVERCQTAETT